MTAETAFSKSTTCGWLRWVLLVAPIVGGFAACDNPHKNVMQFEPNYPRRNPNPSRTVSISGRIPQNLQIKFFAYYAASRILGYDACYRGTVGPTIPLHLAEPLDAERDASSYRLLVTVDKYQPGECGWVLDAVGYQLLDKDPVLDREEGFETGGVKIVNFYQGDKLPAANNSPMYWRGRVDLWCYKGPIGDRMQVPETCALLGGFPPDFQAIGPEDQKGSNASTWIFPDARSAEVNFRNLNALVAEHAEKR
jgi:hypothetical protein